MLSFAKPVFKTFLRDFTLLKKVVVDQTMKLFSRPNNVIVWRISILVTLEELYWITNFVKDLFREISIYYQANINMEKSLLIHDLLLLHMIQLSHKNKNVFDSFTNSK